MRGMLLMSNQGWPVSVTRATPRLDQLDQHAAGVLGVHEVDPAARRAAPGLVVQQPQAALAQHRADRLDVGDPVGELLEARAGAVEELRDRRLGGQRGEQLDPGPPSPTASIASRTPCSSLVSSCTEATPKVRA